VGKAGGVVTRGDISSLIERAQSMALEAGWHASILDCLPKLSPAAVEKICLCIARDLIQRDRAKRALEDMRDLFADNGLLVVNIKDIPLLALAIWRDESVPSKPHPKLGPRATSPFLMLRRAVLREQRRRELDGQLPQRLRGTEAEADRHAAEEWRTPGTPAIEAQKILDELIQRIHDARTRREIRCLMNGDTLSPADRQHLKRQFPRIRELHRQLTELRRGKG
jgi:hypothetical protein